MTAFKHNLNRILTVNRMFACSALMVFLSLWVISDRMPCWAPLNGLAMLMGLGGIASVSVYDTGRNRGRELHSIGPQPTATGLILPIR